MTYQRPPASPRQVDFDGRPVVVEKLTRLRRTIANAMIMSVQGTAQLTAVVDVDMTAVMDLRESHRDAFKAEHGVGLSPLAVIARGVCMVMARHPVINASIDMEVEEVTYHRSVNLGIAVDTEHGLFVPNLKDAQDRDIPSIAVGIRDVAERSRSKKLGYEDITGGTFTITNTGSVGSTLDTPLLNHPESAILATAAVERRPRVVIDGSTESIQIRWASYLCLTYDHRLIDGADASRFLQDLRHTLETHDFEEELGLKTS